MGFRKILCPIDFSAGSTEALGVAVKLANDADADLVLAHAWHVPVALTLPDSGLPASAIQSLTDDADRGLQKVVEQARSLGARRISSQLLRGAPWAEIVQLLEQDPQFDLVVMGTHGRTGLSRILLGSVAEKVVRHSPCSVLAVRKAGQGFAHILCPIDFSPESRFAVETAAQLAKPMRASVVLMHATELPINYSGEPMPMDFVRDLDRIASLQLDAFATQCRETLHVPISTLTRVGAPAGEVLAVLDEGHAFDLVALGSHGRTGIKRVLLGSVAETVVRHARCPVLVARRRPS